MAEFPSIRNIPENLLKIVQIQYQKAWDTYTGLLLKDPAISTRLEALLRISSYIVPGRFAASKELGELLYGLSNLLALLHDCIFRQNLKLAEYEGADKGKQLLMYLSVIESIEVFLEMSTERLWGEIGKWFVVVLIQLSKVVIRMILLYTEKPKLQKYPLIPLLNRDMVFQAVRNKMMCKDKSAKLKHEDNLDEQGGDVEQNDNLSDEQQNVWRGKRTGRFIRSLAASPPNCFRSWKPPQTSEGDDISSELNQKQFFAELLYVIRPLLHLPSMFIFGETSWKPWLFACVADITSLGLHTKWNPKLTAMEKSEISRRMLLIMFYLLRSPFYDRLTKIKIVSILGSLSRNIPFLSVIINPLLDYLPSWQRTYFYNWCS